MTDAELLTQSQAREHYNEITPIFIEAFAGEPWYEVSKCVDDQTPKRCPNSFSPTPIGRLCDTCVATPVQPAYTPSEVAADFEKNAGLAELLWYVEREESEIVLAGYAAQHTVPTLLASSYRRHAQAMEQPLVDIVGNRSAVWLHELFADRSKRPTGNLRNFGSMCVAFAEAFDNDLFMYCTINDRMISAATRAFDDRVTVYKPHVDIPDHRYLVTINL